MVIDCHTHIFPPSAIERRGEFAQRDPWFGELYGAGARMATRDDLLRSMDSAGIDRSVVLGFGWQNAADCTLGNEYLMESAGRSDGRLLPFITVVSGGDQAEEEIARWANGGLRGIGELYADSQGFDLTDPATLGPVVDACLAHDLFLCVHVTEPAGHEYAGKDGNGPAQVARFVAAIQADLKLLLPHWGGGFGFYEMMPEMAARTAHCLYDCAASHLLYDERVYEVMTRLAPGRVVFGSDFPLTTQARMLRRVRKAGLRADDLAALLGGNAVRAGLG
jgi:predicted TIM-barrel fold metal-dependent hydrolase